MTDMPVLHHTAKRKFAVRSEASLGIRECDTRERVSCWASDNGLLCDAQLRKVTTLDRKSYYELNDHAVKSP
jgi:hypothetical protein